MVQVSNIISRTSVWSHFLIFSDKCKTQTFFLLLLVTLIGLHTYIYLMEQVYYFFSEITDLISV